VVEFRKLICGMTEPCKEVVETNPIGTGCKNQRQTTPFCQQPLGMNGKNLQASGRKPCMKRTWVEVVGNHERDHGVTRACRSAK